MTTDHNTELKIKENLFSGKVEATDFNDVDSAVVRVISEVLDTIHKFDPSLDRNSRLNAFLSRPETSQKIAVGEYDSPKRFVKALASKIKKKPIRQDVDQPRAQVKNAKLELPFIFVTRDPSIYPDDEVNTESVIAPQEVLNNDGNLMGVFDASSWLVSYRVFIVGWNMTEVSQIATSILLWSRHRSKNHRFTYKSPLGGSPVDLPAEIVTPSQMSFDNASEPTGEGKLRALTSELRVSACIGRLQYAEQNVIDLSAGRGGLLD